MFLAWLFLAITIKSYSSKYLLVEVEKEDNKVLKQEGEACGSVAAEPNSDCGECDEGLFCDTGMSPAPPMQCGKCVKRNAADRMVKMDLSSKEKGNAIKRDLPCIKEGEECFYEFPERVCCPGLNCHLPMEVPPFPFSLRDERYQPSYCAPPSKPDLKTKVCKTVGSGNEVNKSCVFPFIYKSVAYDACTLTDRGKFWCNTEVDFNGIGVSEKWGYCNHFCPVEWPDSNRGTRNN